MAYRSKFESHVAKWFRKEKIKVGYETLKIPFVQPEKARTYTPDFELLGSGVYVECKGKFTAEDRAKILWVKEQHPDLRLVMLFQRANNFIRKGSKTRYRDWCEKHGIEWCDWETGNLTTIRKVLSR